MPFYCWVCFLCGGSGWWAVPVLLWRSSLLSCLAVHFLPLGFFPPTLIVRPGLMSFTCGFLVYLSLCQFVLLHVCILVLLLLLFFGLSLIFGEHFAVAPVGFLCLFEPTCFWPSLLFTVSFPVLTKMQWTTHAVGSRTPVPSVGGHIWWRLQLS